MTSNTSKQIYQTLGVLLEAEKKALISGDLETVGGLVSQKETLIETLRSFPVRDQVQMMRLHEKISRNQALFDRALDGIRSVTRRLAALRNVRGTLEVYDARGSRQSVNLKNGTSLEKRA